MTTFFKTGSRSIAGALLIFGFVILSLVLEVTAYQDPVVAVVGGRPIRLSEIRPVQSQADAKRSALGTVAYKRWLEEQEKDRLSRRIWCEVSREYLPKHGLEPTAEEIKSYSSRLGSITVTECAPNTESNPQATLSRLKFDQWLYRKYGGLVVARGSELLPIEARTAFLKDAREDGIVKIVDPIYAKALDQTKENASARVISNDEAKAYFERPWWSAGIESQQSDKRGQPYVITTLLENKQVRIDCSNGNRFVIRRRADDRWYEELMIPVVGTEVGYKTPSEAASIRCRVSPNPK